MFTLYFKIGPENHPTGYSGITITVSGSSINKYSEEGMTERLSP